MLAWRQIQVRLLSNAQYVTYSNYVKDKNTSQYESMTHCYKTIFKGIVFQFVVILWSAIVVHHVWFTVISLVASAFVLLEATLVNWSFPN